MAQKIAILGIRGIPNNFPGSSGIDTYIEQLLPYFSQDKFTLYARSWAKKSRTKLGKNIKTIYIPCVHHKYFDTGIYTFLSTIFAIFHQNQIFWYQAPGSCLLIILAHLFGKKTILTVHGIDWQRQKWNNYFNRWFLKFLESMAIQNADVCTGVSEDVCQYVINKYHKPCVLTPSSLVIKKPIPINLISQKFKISNQQPFLLYLGRLVPEKKIELLIKAYLQNHTINQTYKLIIAGLIEKNSYCKSIVKLSSKNSNIILTGFVTGQIKQELLSNCHLFILPSNLEGNSLALNEALGLNKICLVSNLPIHQEYQKKFTNIITFKTNSISDFKQKLEKSIQSTIVPMTNINSTWKETAKIYKNIFKKI